MIIQCHGCSLARFNESIMLLRIYVSYVNGRLFTTANPVQLRRCMRSYLRSYSSLNLTIAGHVYCCYGPGALNNGILPAMIM